MLSKDKYLSDFLVDYLKLIVFNIGDVLNTYYIGNKYAAQQGYFEQIKLTHDIELDNISEIIEEQYESAYQLEMPKNHIYVMGLGDSPRSCFKGGSNGYLFSVDALSGFDFNTQSCRLENIFHISRLNSGATGTELHKKFTSEPLLLTDVEAVKNWMKEFDQFTSEFAKECLKELSDNIDYYFYEFYRNLAE